VCQASQGRLSFSRLPSAVCILVTLHSIFYLVFFRQCVSLNHSGIDVAYQNIKSELIFVTTYSACEANVLLAPFLMPLNRLPTSSRPVSLHNTLIKYGLIRFKEPGSYLTDKHVSQLLIHRLAGGCSRGSEYYPLKDCICRYSQGSIISSRSRYVVCASR
jgi:hypothetical protein